MPTRIKMSFAEDYVSDYDFPPGYIQGGTSGLVFTPNGSNYRTAFIEFFPENGSFIRGEGKTIQEAEIALINKLNKQTACINHEYVPRNYTNGVGFCKHCGRMKSHAFTAEELGQFCRECGIPTGVKEGRRVSGADKESFVFVCDNHDELKPYHDMMMYFSLEYDGEEDIDNPEFYKNITVLKEIYWEQRTVEPELLEYFEGVKAREMKRLQDEQESTTS